MITFRTKDQLSMLAFLWLSTYLPTAQSFQLSDRARHTAAIQKTRRFVVNDAYALKRRRRPDHNLGPKFSTDGQILLPDAATQLEYSRNGHAVMRKLLSPDYLKTVRNQLYPYALERELSAWQQKVEVAADSPELGASCTSVEECMDKLIELEVPYDDLPFLQFFNTWRDIKNVRWLAEELAEVSATLMDVPSVRLYQDSLFWKRSGDGPTPWHVDARMAPFDTSHMVTLWIPLQEVPSAEDGGTALVFCSRSHSDFALPFWTPYNDDDDNDASPWNNLEDRYAMEGHKVIVDYMPMATGDVTAHSGWTLHCSDANDILDEDRLALSITYVDATAPIRKEAFEANCKGDAEDRQSYKDWIKQVPHSSRKWTHELAPILWPPEHRNE